MYMKLSKKELATMLINCNNIIDAQYKYNNPVVPYKSIWGVDSPTYNGPLITYTRSK
jgi:hypothetical protein